MPRQVGDPVAAALIACTFVAALASVPGPVVGDSTCPSYYTCVDCLCGMDGGCETWNNPNCEWCGGSCVDSSNETPSECGVSYSGSTWIDWSSADDGAVEDAARQCPDLPKCGACKGFLAFIWICGIVVVIVCYYMRWKENKFAPNRARHASATSRAVIAQAQPLAQNLIAGRPGDRLLWIGCSSVDIKTPQQVEAQRRRGGCDCCGFWTTFGTSIGYLVPAFIWSILGTPLSDPFNDVTGFWLSTTIPFGICTFINLIILLVVCLDGSSSTVPSAMYAYAITNRQVIVMSLSGAKELVDPKSLSVNGRVAVASFEPRNLVDISEVNVTQGARMVSIKSTAHREKTLYFRSVYNENGEFFKGVDFLMRLQSAARGGGEEALQAAAATVVPSLGAVEAGHYAPPPTTSGAGLLTGHGGGPVAYGTGAGAGAAAGAAGYCGKCRTPVSAEDRFCRACGAPVAPPAPSPSLAVASAPPKDTGDLPPESSA